MKEEAPNMLPPKIVGGLLPSGNNTNNTTNNNNNNNNTNNAVGTTQAAANKIGSDEILSTLLRLNNFDSISSIKDESLDIDLSACVTISPAGIINGNSLSSSDFWRVLDESAQIPEKEVPNASIKNEVKEELPSSFSGTFLRPDPPAAIAISPVKKLAKSRSHAGEQKRRKLKTAGKPTLTMDQLTNGGNSSTLSSPPPPPTLIIKKEVTDAFTFENVADEGSDMCDYKATECKIEDAPQHKLISLPSFSEIHGVKQQQQQVKNTLNTAASITAASAITNVTQNVLAFSQTVDLSQMINMANVNVLNNLSSHTTKITTANANANNNTNNTANNHKLTQQTHQQQQQHQSQQQFDGLESKAKQQNQMQQTTQPKQPAETRAMHKCTDCDQEFEQEAALKKHMKTHRSAADARKDAWKKCPDCGKCLKLGSMWMHRKIHSDNRKYECDICGQKFVQKINLTHHARIHTSEKPYECPECQKRFQERSHLQRHQKYHAQTRSYRCDKCGKMYKTERCLKVHNLVHLERRPFACTVCDKSFISNSKLKQHLNIHTGARPFKCNYCPRDFTNFPNWLKHTRRRHKVDHKTGEQLENIPSYCSKKSTASAANTPTTAANTPPASSAGANNSASVAQIAATNGTAKPQLQQYEQQQQQQQLQTKSHAINGTPNFMAENSKFLIKTNSVKSENNLPKTPTVRRKKKAALGTTPAQPNDKKIAAELMAGQKATAAATMKTNANVLIGVDDNAIIVTPTKANNANAVTSTTPPTTTTTIALTLTTTLSTTAPMLTKSTNSLLAANVGTLANNNNNNNNSNNSSSSSSSNNNNHSNSGNSNNNNNNSNNNNNNSNSNSNNMKANASASANANVNANAITPTTTTAATIIMPKIKRERKQLSPKQVPLELVTQLSPIKTEPNDLERKHLITNFLDLHCLSLTSAEELIMEQALEMEECGLYDAPVSAVFN